MRLKDNVDCVSTQVSGISALWALCDNEAHIVSIETSSAFLVVDKPLGAAMTEYPRWVELWDAIKAELWSLKGLPPKIIQDLPLPE